MSRLNVMGTSLPVKLPWIGSGVDILEFGDNRAEQPIGVDQLAGAPRSAILIGSFHRLGCR
ncbi:MAG TPA: hypothetical protein VIT90_02650 [Lysobacter sp.]